MQRTRPGPSHLEREPTYEGVEVFRELATGRGRDRWTKAEFKSLAPAIIATGDHVPRGGKTAADLATAIGGTAVDPCSGAIGVALGEGMTDTTGAALEPGVNTREGVGPGGETKADPPSGVTGGSAAVIETIDPIDVKEAALEAGEIAIGLETVGEQVLTITILEGPRGYRHVGGAGNAFATENVIGTEIGTGTRSANERVGVARDRAQIRQWRGRPRWPKMNSRNGSSRRSENARRRPRPI